MMKTLIQSIRMLVVLTLLTGIIYPVVMTVAAQAIFPTQANGSLIQVNGQPVGSELIGQPFSSNKYFWGRPSATGVYGYGIDAVKDANGAPVPDQYTLAGSSGSNAGPTNASFAQAVKDRTEALRKAHGLPADVSVPADLVQASASGLDPHITPEAAKFQVDRVARARGLDSAKVVALVDQFTEPPTYLILGMPRVNVLKLNIALDALK